MNKALTNEENSIHLKRLRYRSLHRGCKEMDIIFERFAQAGLDALDAAELKIFEALLEENDNDIWDWVTEKIPAPEEYHALMQKLRTIP